MKMAFHPIRERAAEKRADQLISQLAISDVEDLDVEAIAMTQKALVVYGGLSGAEARLSRSPRLSFIRVNDAIPESGRKRFAIAHELGHLLLQDGSQLALCSDRELIGFYTNSPEELEANAFAASLLMPAALFGPLCRSVKPTLKAIGEMADRFQVTLTAACGRYLQFSPHRCCLVVSKDGRIKYHRKTNEFGYFITLREELKSATYAADYFRGEPLPSGMQSVEATAWLEGARIDSSKMIKEDSVAMPAYNSVLTLLWIDKDIDRHVSGEDEYDAEEAESDSRWSWNRYRDPER